MDNLFSIAQAAYEENIRLKAELDQYRKLGTPSDIQQNLKDFEELIELFKKSDSITTFKPLNITPSELVELVKARGDCTYRKFRKLAIQYRTQTEQYRPMLTLVRVLPHHIKLW